jgi:hypothetical protein
MISALLAAICLVPFISSQGSPASDVAAQLNAIHRAYLKSPDIAGLVELDRKMRKLVHEPWKRAGQSIDGKIFQPQWSAIGIDVGHYSDALEYSGKLLVEAHKKNPVSEFRRFTLFADVMGERPSHGLGEMPNVNVALQYLKEFPQGPFAREVDIILGNFYCDLFKVIIRLQQKQPSDYKTECFGEYVANTDLGAQASTARRLSISYYAQALTAAPEGWKETIDVRHWQSAMEGGDPAPIDAMGWHFCAD